MFPRVSWSRLITSTSCSTVFWIQNSSKVYDCSSRSFRNNSSTPLTIERPNDRMACWVLRVLIVTWMVTRRRLSISSATFDRRKIDAGSRLLRCVVWTFRDYLVHSVRWNPSKTLLSLNSGRLTSMATLYSPRRRAWTFSNAVHKFTSCRSFRRCSTFHPPRSSTCSDDWIEAGLVKARLVVRICSLVKRSAVCVTRRRITQTTRCTILPLKDFTSREWKAAWWSRRRERSRRFRCEASRSRRRICTMVVCWRWKIRLNFSISCSS